MLSGAEVFWRAWSCYPMYSSESCFPMRLWHGSPAQELSFGCSNKNNIYWREFLVPCAKNRTAGVMVFGIISFPVCLIGTKKCKDYRQLLCGASASKFADTPRQKRTKFSLQQDHCSTHTSEAVRQFSAAENLIILPWHSKSPDLNSIKNVWSGIKNYIANNPRPPNTRAELKVVVIEAWEAKHAWDWCEDLYNSSPNCLNAVIENVWLANRLLTFGKQVSCWCALLILLNVLVISPLVIISCGFV